MTYHRILNKSNMRMSISGEGTAYQPRCILEFMLLNLYFHVAQSLLSCCSIFTFMCSILSTILCYFVLFLLIIVLSVLLPFKAYAYIFDIFQPFLPSRSKEALWRNYHRMIATRICIIIGYDMKLLHFKGHYLGTPYEQLDIWRVLLYVERT